MERGIILSFLQVMLCDRAVRKLFVEAEKSANSYTPFPDTIYFLPMTHRLSSDTPFCRMLTGRIQVFLELSEKHIRSP